MTKKTKRQKIGLALGGGAALGPAHVGVLKAFEELEIEIDMLAGTSVGALVGSLYAFGMSVDEITEISGDLDWFDISDLTLSKFGVLSNSKMKKFLKKTIDNVQFEDAQIPFSVVTTDITTGERVVIDKGDVTKAVMASACIPGVFVPVDYNGRLLVDGGVSENVPISPLAKRKADLIIGVDLNASFLRKKPRNIIDVLINSFHFTLMSATEAQTKEAHHIIAPDLSDFNLTSTRKSKEKIERGYESAMKVLKKLK